MKLNRAQLVSKGCVVFQTLLVVFAIILLVDSHLFNCARKAGTVSIAPAARLESAADMFKLRLKAESMDFPVEEMVTTEAWGQLQSTVAAYTERLELIESQDRQRFRIESYIFVASAIGMVVFSRLRKQTGAKV